MTTENDVPVIMTPEHIAQLKRLVAECLAKNPDATNEEISQHCSNNGYCTVDREMFGEWLVANGFKS